MQGTLSEPNTGCNEVGGYGGEFSFSNKFKSSSSDEWTVNVNAIGHKKGGTFEKFGRLIGNGVSIVLEGTNANTAYYWIPKSGVLTTTPTSGKVNVVLGPDQSFSGKPGKGTIHLTGSWGCVVSS